MDTAAAWLRILSSKRIHSEIESSPCWILFRTCVSRFFSKLRITVGYLHHPTIAYVKYSWVRRLSNNERNKYDGVRLNLCMVSTKHHEKGYKGWDHSTKRVLKILYLNLCFKNDGWVPAVQILKIPIILSKLQHTVTKISIVVWLSYFEISKWRPGIYFSTLDEPRKSLTLPAIMKIILRF